MSAKTDPNSKTDNLANEDCRPVPCSADYADNPQFVRMEDGYPVMRCSECETEYSTGSEGITTSDDLELCIGCQADLRHLYDEDWNLLPNTPAHQPGERNDHE